MYGAIVEGCLLQWLFCFPDAARLYPGYGVWLTFIVACRVSSYGVGLNKYKVDSRLRENDEGMALLSAIFYGGFQIS